MNVAPSKKIEAIVVSEEEEVRQTFITGALFFKSLAGASELKVQKDKTEVPENALSIVTGDATIFLPLEELVDIQAERERLSKEEARLLGEIKRSNGMLGNEKFLAKAPEAKVREEKEKLEKYQGMLAQVRERIAKL